MPEDHNIDDQSSSSVARTACPLQNEPRGPVSTSTGFTLVELLMVVTIIGILATMAIQVYTTFVNHAKTARAKQEIRLLETEINAYLFENDQLPDNLAQIGRNDLLDPWGNNYVYYKIVLPSEDDPLARRRFGTPLNNDFDLCSKGVDGATEVSVAEGSSGGDDLVRGAEGAFLGFGGEWAG